MPALDDPELAAMAKVYEALVPLDQECQIRVLDWVLQKIGLSDRKLSSPAIGHIPAPSGAAVERKTREGTINGVTVKLGADSCRTLLVAAAAYLTLYQGKESFTREEWVGLAKEARMWKSDYSTQTSGNINRLLASEEVFEKSKDLFALSLPKLQELEEKLAK